MAFIAHDMTFFSLLVHFSPFYLVDSYLTLPREFPESLRFLVEHEFPLIGPKKFMLDARRLKRQGNKGFLILLAIEEFTTQAN
jgi:hypothetical protein